MGKKGLHRGAIVKVKKTGQLVCIVRYVSGLIYPYYVVPVEHKDDKEYQPSPYTGSELEVLEDA